MRSRITDLMKTGLRTLVHLVIAVVVLVVALLLLLSGVEVVNRWMAGSPKHLATVNLSTRMKEIKQYPWVKPDTMRFHERYERVKEGMGLTEVLALLGDPDEKDEIGSDGIPLYWDRGFAISYILEKPERDTDLGEGDATLWFTPSGKLEKKEIFSDSEYEYLKSHRSTASIPNGVSHPAPKKILKSRASAFKEIR